MDNGRCNIFVRMSGGLGNQLFQLSAGIYAALPYPGATIWLDTRFLGKYEAARSFEVDFVVKHLPSVSIAKSSVGMAGLASSLRVGRLLDTFWAGYACISTTEGLKRVQEKSISWMVLDGYFQHPDLVLSALGRQDLFAKLSGEFGYLIESVSPSVGVPRVGIHIRRGDYVSSKTAARVFRTIPSVYLTAAVSQFDSMSRFLVFSDDPATASAFSKEIGGVDVSALGMSLSDEFCMFMACDHYVIANSTFSWWASYLGYAPGKRVIAPRNWYVDAARSKANPLLLPHFELLDA